MAKLVAYIRVSTAGQAEDGHGLELQREAIEAWARAQHHDIFCWCSDEGLSGAIDALGRRGLAEALSAVKAGLVTGVVVFKLDRLARDLIVQEQLLAEVRRIGGAVFSTSTGEAAYLTDDPDDPSRKMIRQVLGAVNEYERGVISLRLRMGRERKAALGGFAFGSPPFGLRSEGKELVEDAREAAVVGHIRALRDEGLGLRAIALRLNSEGLPSKRGGGWHAQTVSRVLARAA